MTTGRISDPTPTGTAATVTDEPDEPDQPFESAERFGSTEPFGSTPALGPEQPYGYERLDQHGRPSAAAPPAAPPAEATAPTPTTIPTTPPDADADVLRRRAERALQAIAFDAIGAGYAEAFPAKGGQLACGDWLLRELEPGATVLDVGCGTGDPTVRQLTDGGLHVTGVDLADGMLSLARTTAPTAAYHRLDMYDLATDRAGHAWNAPGLGPAGTGRFAAVTAFFSLILLPQDEIPIVLRRIHRLLRPGGLLALGTVEADLDHCPLPFLGHEIRISGYLREELERVLVQAGFTVEGLHGLSYAPASTTLPPEEQLFLRCRRTG
ncbi:methyltransferase domain-containing protein [Kitasatospora sp. NPDC050543]|uniref:class I SAM-dependent methyltransferase n=1 Tax=Kitasatospora sp. NPDC050543 TaxID=3364054 RepID=UPI0037ADB5BD